MGIVSFLSGSTASLDTSLIHLLSRIFALIGVVWILAYGAQTLGFPLLSVLAGLGIGGIAAALAMLAACSGSPPEILAIDLRLALTLDAGKPDWRAHPVSRQADPRRRLLPVRQPDGYSGADWYKIDAGESARSHTHKSTEFELL